MTFSRSISNKPGTSSQSTMADRNWLLQAAYSNYPATKSSNTTTMRQFFRDFIWGKLNKTFKMTRSCLRHRYLRTSERKRQKYARIGCKESVVTAWDAPSRTAGTRSRRKRMLPRSTRQVSATLTTARHFSASTVPAANSPIWHETLAMITGFSRTATCLLKMWAKWWLGSIMPRNPISTLLMSPVPTSKWHKIFITMTLV